MELISLKLAESETGFILTFESGDADMRGYWKAKILEFLAGNCTCSCCAGGGCECSCHDLDDEDG